ncbi:MAG: helix-turn-helix domain-containing protein [Sulfuritalea sp.]|nr:helix-turn-helix domain-containing protein [Sulfuritalea sp.]
MGNITKIPSEAQDVLSRLSERISIARKARDWTQADLADRAGIGRGTLIEIEKGSPYVGMDSYMKTLWALNLHHDMDKVGLLESDTAAQQLMASSLPRRVRPRR